MRHLFEKACGQHDTTPVGDARWPVPKSVAHLCTPSSTLTIIHGLRVGEDKCTCGHPIEATSSCPACGRPYQTRCNNDGCDNWVQAEEKTSTGWYPPPSTCTDCRAVARDQMLKSRLQHIPARMRSIAQTYDKRPGREHCNEVIVELLQTDLAQILFLHGPRKAGKSIAAARLAMNVVLKERRNGVMWLEYEDLCSAAKRCYMDDGAKQWALIDKAMHCEFLVLDDLFPMVRKAAHGKILAVERMSAHVMQLMTDLMRKRLHKRLTTVITSVHTPEQALGFLGEHVYNWFQEVGVEAHVASEG